MTEPKPYSFRTKEGHHFSGIDGQLHSVDDNPAVTYADGTKWWYRDGKIHRDNGPAVVWASGAEEWFQDNVRHRTGGPACTFPNTPQIDQEYRGVSQHWEHGRLIREDVPVGVQHYRAELIALRKKHGMPI